MIDILFTKLWGHHIQTKQNIKGLMFQVISIFSHWILINQIMSDCNAIQTYNHLVGKPTLNHLAKLTKWSSSIVKTYFYDGSDCMFLSCHVLILEWIYTLQLPECEETLCSKQAWYLKFKWLQGNWKCKVTLKRLNDMIRTRKLTIFSSILFCCW